MLQLDDGGNIYGNIEASYMIIAFDELGEPLVSDPWHKDAFIEIGNEDVDGI